MVEEGRAKGIIYLPSSFFFFVFLLCVFFFFWACRCGGGESEGNLPYRMSPHP